MQYNDLSCRYAVRGCTAKGAINFFSHAQEDDGSCLHVGCMSSGAVNFNPSANVDDGSCYTPSSPPLRSQRLLFADANGSSGYCSNQSEDSAWASFMSGLQLAMPTEVRNLPVCGCTLETATNFDSLANADDDSCRIIGCKDSIAENYDAEATEPGECIYTVYGCTIASAHNYDSLATSFWDTSRCHFAIYGCTDSYAWNYNALATDDDGSCEVLSEGCTDPVAYNFDPNATLDTGCLYEGCTDSTAKNWDEVADIDDGSCIEIILGCTFQGTYPWLAQNWNPDATDYDGSCNMNRVGN